MLPKQSHNIEEISLKDYAKVIYINLESFDIIDFKLIKFYRCKDCGFMFEEYKARPNVLYSYDKKYNFNLNCKENMIKKIIE